jgi:ferrochelatase
MKIVVLLMNLGGPDKLENVEKFLFNLFYDKYIIRLPKFFRYLLAKTISKTRNKKSQKIYDLIGGSSPIVKETKNGRVTKRKDDSISEIIADEG